MKTRSEKGNRDEENISRLDYELSSCGDLLARAMKPIRGQVFLWNSFISYFLKDVQNWN